MDSWNWDQLLKKLRMGKKLPLVSVILAQELPDAQLTGSCYKIKRQPSIQSLNAYQRVSGFLKQDKNQVMSPPGAPQLGLQGCTSKACKETVVLQHNRDLHSRSPSEHRKQKLRETSSDFLSGQGYKQNSTGKCHNVFVLLFWTAPLTSIVGHT